jgi:hypothetical protein
LRSSEGFFIFWTEVYVDIVTIGSLVQQICVEWGEGRVRSLFLREA